MMARDPLRFMQALKEIFEDIKGRNGALASAFGDDDDTDTKTIRIGVTPEEHASISKVSSRVPS